MFFVFSVPKDPNCQPKEPVVLANRTNTTITLGLAMLKENNMGENLCVMTNPKSGDSQCRPFLSSTMLFNNLQSSNQYNFAVFSYHNTSRNSLYSSSSCLISVYTCKISNIYFSLSLYLFSLV